MFQIINPGVRQKVFQYKSKKVIYNLHTTTGNDLKFSERRFSIFLGHQELKGF